MRASALKTNPVLRVELRGIVVPPAFDALQYDVSHWRPEYPETPENNEDDEVGGEGVVVATEKEDAEAEDEQQVKSVGEKKKK